MKNVEDRRESMRLNNKIDMTRSQHRTQNITADHKNQDKQIFENNHNKKGSPTHL